MTSQTDQWKNEIAQVETEFAAMAAREGLSEAFLAYAAEDAVISRGDKLYRGKNEMGSYFDQSTLREVQLTWSPAFIDVSASGDLAYTYGPYSFSAVDSSGEPVEATGIFHTVWKRQADQSWKFVWD